MQVTKAYLGTKRTSMFTEYYIPTNALTIYNNILV
jgi:hypothetical protein